MRGNGIKKIGDLFETYRKRLRAPQKTVIDTFVEVVRDVCQMTIKDKDIAYSPASRTLVIRASGPLKTEVLLHKGELLTHLKGRLGTASAPTDII